MFNKLCEVKFRSYQKYYLAADFMSVSSNNRNEMKNLNEVIP